MRIKSKEMSLAVTFFRQGNWTRVHSFKVSSVTTTDSSHENIRKLCRIFFSRKLIMQFDWTHSTYLWLYLWQLGLSVMIIPSSLNHSVILACSHGRSLSLKPVQSDKKIDKLTFELEKIEWLSYLLLICLQNPENEWEQELYKQFKYKTATSTFHTFNAHVRRWKITNK